MLGVLLGVMALNEPITDLNRQLNNFHNMTADVSQVTETQSGQDLSSSGKIWISKPDRFRYQISKPNKQLYVSDGHQLWTYEQALLQVIVQPLNKQIEQTPMLLLSGKVEDVNKLFNVKSLAKNQFVLTPKKQDNLISKILLVFKLNHPEEMQLTNPFGQVTTITFTNVKLNRNMSQNFFRFTPPAGVDVLKQ